jgi:hypothetical protein
VDFSLVPGMPPIPAGERFGRLSRPNTCCYRKPLVFEVTLVDPPVLTGWHGAPYWKDEVQGIQTPWKSRPQQHPCRACCKSIVNGMQESLKATVAEERNWPSRTSHPNKSWCHWCCFRTRNKSSSRSCNWCGRKAGLAIRNRELPVQHWLSPTNRANKSWRRGGWCSRKTQLTQLQWVKEEGWIFNICHLHGQF